jgi:hypothetical protein
MTKRYGPYPITRLPPVPDLKDLCANMTDSFIIGGLLGWRRPILWVGTERRSSWSNTVRSWWVQINSGDEKELFSLLVHWPSCDQSSDPSPSVARITTGGSHLLACRTLPLPITSSHINGHSSITKWQRTTGVGSKSGGGQIYGSHSIADQQAWRFNTPLNADGKLWRFARDKCQRHIPSHFRKIVSVTTFQMSMGS